MECNYEAMYFVPPLPPLHKKFSTVKMHHPRLYCDSRSILELHEAIIRNKANGEIHTAKKYQTL
jgi:hypothetical protein